MELTGYLSLVLIAVNIIFSYKGFANTAFFNKYAFGVDKVLVHKDYKLLVTSGFLHMGWMHLLFNMFSLYVFSQAIEVNLGGAIYLLIYFVSLIVGNLFSLRVHRHQADYTAVGASGAVCGIIFASIAVFPGMHIGFFILPISIPAWLYGILFVIYSIYGIRSRNDNIGHEAHLAGALAGLITAIIFFPDALWENTLTILLLLIPSAIFILFIARNPTALLVSNPFTRKRDHSLNPDHRYNLQKQEKQKEIDRILEKIHRRGLKSLTQKERDILNGH